MTEEKIFQLEARVKELGRKAGEPPRYSVISLQRSASPRGIGIMVSDLIIKILTHMGWRICFGSEFTPNFLQRKWFFYHLSDRGGIDEFDQGEIWERILNVV